MEFLIIASDAMQEIIEIIRQLSVHIVDAVSDNCFFKIFAITFFSCPLTTLINYCDMLFPLQSSQLK